VQGRALSVVVGGGGISTEAIGADSVAVDDGHAMVRLGLIAAFA